VAELNLTIHFNKDIAHIKLIQLISPVYELVAGDSLYLTVVFSNQVLRSENLLIIVSVVNFLRTRGIIITIEVDGQSTYAGRIDFYKLIDIPFNEKYIRRNSKGRFIELKSFDKDAIYKLQDELNIILYQNAGISKEVLELLFYCLGEIMDNTLVHSGLSTGWVAAQYYPQSQEIRLTICDSGLGIHHSLTHHPETKYKDVSEREALNLCIQRGVTNGEGLGFGLFATSQFILKNNGDLLLYSGNHYLLAQNGNYAVKQGNYFQGTLVSLRINANVPVNYKEIMPEGHTLPDDYDYFIDKFFGENNELW
jgi:hypothetical protein